MVEVFIERKYLIPGRKEIPSTAHSDFTHYASIVVQVCECLYKIMGLIIFEVHCDLYDFFIF